MSEVLDLPEQLAAGTGGSPAAFGPAGARAPGVFSAPAPEVAPFGTPLGVHGVQAPADIAPPGSADSQQI